MVFRETTSDLAESAEWINPIGCGWGTCYDSPILGLGEGRPFRAAGWRPTAVATHHGPVYVSRVFGAGIPG
ncbi:MAG: hypothetical protein HKP61_20810 [Dactylosporangium sp.]|nr:hypothetical protein [Dactylosporangium sp.]